MAPRNKGRSLPPFALPPTRRPWLYYGMLFASFCWHKEDHNLYSINYLHHGASKTWHAVPGSAEKALQRALKQSVPRRFEEVRPRPGAAAVFPRC